MGSILPESSPRGFGEATAIPSETFKRAESDMTGINSAYAAAAPEKARVAAIQATIEGQIAARRKKPGISSTLLTNAIPQSNGVPTINPGYVSSLLSADVTNNTLLTGKTNVR